MKKDILILSTHSEHTESAYALLSEHNIPVTIVADRQNALLFMRVQCPAFCWIDLEIEAARSLLTEIMETFLNPPPYIILTSSFSDSADRADMLDYGADVCVGVPVDLKEILAILNAVLRREEKLRYVNTASMYSPIKYKQLFIDPLHHKVMMGAQTVKLTPKEYDILYLMATSPGMVFTKEQIYSRIWKADALMGIDVVFNHISSLRKKMGLGPRDDEYIQTVYKVGYRFAAHE